MAIMESPCYISGGRLGDLIHALYVVSRRFAATGQRGRLLIRNKNDSFSRPLEDTYRELLPIVTSQPYIESFEMVPEGDPPTDSAWVDLSDWRSHDPPDLDWFELLNATYHIDNPDNGPWMSHNYKDTRFTDLVVIHRSGTTFRQNPYFPWESIIRHNKCIFVTTSRLTEYETFPFKHAVPCFEVYDLSSLFTVINSARYFVGNQSSPLAIATALGKPCLAELCSTDYKAYLRSPFCNGKLAWFLSPLEHDMARAPIATGGSTLSLPVSIGEGMDKLTILLLKLKSIQDEDKKRHVRTEMESIEPFLREHVARHAFYFQCLIYVNHVLWEMCNAARDSMEVPYAVVQIENDARFRIKNRINRESGSILQEQKSFGCKSVVLTFDDASQDVETKALHLNLYHDTIYLKGPSSEALANKWPSFLRAWTPACDCDRSIDCSDARVPPAFLQLVTARTMSR